MTPVYVKRIDGKIGYIDYADQPDMDLEQMDDGDAEVQAFLNPVPTFYRLSKMTPWLRMTPAEADQIAVAMNAASNQLQQIYLAAPYLQSNDPLWPVLYGLISATLSSERANELLAPET